MHGKQSYTEDGIMAGLFVTAGAAGAAIKTMVDRGWDDKEGLALNSAVNEMIRVFHESKDDEAMRECIEKVETWITQHSGYKIADGRNAVVMGHSINSAH